MNVWLCMSPDSALFTIRGIWQPTQLAKEWMECALLLLITVWHGAQDCEPGNFVCRRVSPMLDVSCTSWHEVQLTPSLACRESFQSWYCW